MKTSKTRNASGIGFVLLVLALTSLTSAYDSGWVSFTDYTGTCGRAYPSCDRSDYGLAWLQELITPTGANYGFLCQYGNCNMVNGAGMGVSTYVPAVGDYYVWVHAHWDSDNNENLYTGVGNFGQDNFNYQVVAENIDNLQFRYLLSDGTWTNDPAAAGQEPNVRAVEISLLARTANTNRGYTDTNTYNIGDVSPTPGDAYRRKLLCSIVKTRNIGL